MKSIVTHQNPDWDAIGGCWLLKLFVFADDVCVYEFVNTGNPDQDILSRADAVVDTGKVYDSQTLRFDHHQLPGDSANNISATLQVWYYLNTTPSCDDIVHLRPLVDLIFAGDTGRPDFYADGSREIGIHALLSGYKAHLRQDKIAPSPNVDYEILQFGFELLDLLALR